MKKVKLFLALLLASVLALSLSACRTDISATKTNEVLTEALEGFDVDTYTQIEGSTASPTGSMQIIYQPLTGGKELFEYTMTILDDEDDEEAEEEFYAYYFSQNMYYHNINGVKTKSATFIDNPHFLTVDAQQIEDISDVLDGSYELKGYQNGDVSYTVYATKEISGITIKYTIEISRELEVTSVTYKATSADNEQIHTTVVYTYTEVEIVLPDDLDTYTTA